MRTIEDERILELTYEGFRFFDLLRWGKVVERFRELENTCLLYTSYDRLHPNTNGQERMAHTLMYQDVYKRQSIIHKTKSPKGHNKQNFTFLN